LSDEEQEPAKEEPSEFHFEVKRLDSKPEPEATPERKVFDEPETSHVKSWVNDQEKELESEHDQMAQEEDRPEIDRNSLARQSRLKAMSMKLRSSEGLEELEKQPAYLRRATKLSEPESGKEISRYSLDNDSDRPALRSDNSYLHDNVD